MLKKTNILNDIVAYKKCEVKEKRKKTSIKSLENSIYFNTETHSLCACLQQNDTSGIIAEIKKKSPSSGVIHPDVSVALLSMEYIAAGASAVSVLTDGNFFGGSNQDLLIARKQIKSPILRKEFIIDEYQVVEAKAIGADAILLIAACLDNKNLKALARLAHSLGLEVLIEVHDRYEIGDELIDLGDIIGINNRNLSTMEVNVDTSRELAELIPDEKTLISESGLQAPEQLRELRSYGFDGFLIGEHFMRTPDPGRACKNFIKKLMLPGKELNNNGLQSN